MIVVAYLVTLMTFFALPILSCPVPSPMMDVASSAHPHGMDHINLTFHGRSPQDFKVDMQQPRHLIMTTGGLFSQKLASLQEAKNPYNEVIHIVPTDINDVDGAIKDHYDIVHHSNLEDHEKAKFRYYINSPLKNAKDYEPFFIKNSYVGRLAFRNAVPLAQLRDHLDSQMPVHMQIMSKPNQNELYQFLEACQETSVDPQLIMHQLANAAAQSTGQRTVEYANNVANLVHQFPNLEVIWADRKHTWDGHDPTGIPVSKIEPYVPDHHVQAAIAADRFLERTICNIDDFIQKHVPMLMLGLTVQDVVPDHLDNLDREAYINMVRTQPETQEAQYGKQRLLEWARERAQILRYISKGHFNNFTEEEMKEAGRMHHRITHDIPDKLSHKEPHLLFGDAANAAALHHALHNNPDGIASKGARLKRVQFGLKEDNLIEAHPNENFPSKMIFDAKSEHAMNHFAQTMRQNSRHGGSQSAPSSSSYPVWSY